MILVNFWFFNPFLRNNIENLLKLMKQDWQSIGASFWIELEGLFIAQSYMFVNCGRFGF